MLGSAIGANITIGRFTCEGSGSTSEWADNRLGRLAFSIQEQIVSRETVIFLHSYPV